MINTVLLVTSFLNSLICSTLDRVINTLPGINFYDLDICDFISINAENSQNAKTHQVFVIENQMVKYYQETQEHSMLDQIVIVSFAFKGYKGSVVWNSI